MLIKTEICHLVYFSAVLIDVRYSRIKPKSKVCKPKYDNDDNFKVWTYFINNINNSKNILNTFFFFFLHLGPTQCKLVYFFFYVQHVNKQQMLKPSLYIACSFVPQQQLFWKKLCIDIEEQTVWNKAILSTVKHFQNYIPKWNEFVTHIGSSKSTQ